MGRNGLRQSPNLPRSSLAKRPLEILFNWGSQYISFGLLQGAAQEGHTHPHTHTHTTHTHTHTTRPPTHTHTHTHTHTPTHKHTYTHPHTHTQLHTHTPHTYTQTHTHTHPHTHRQTHPIHSPVLRYISAHHLVKAKEDCALIILKINPFHPDCKNTFLGIFSQKFMLVLSF